MSKTGRVVGYLVVAVVLVVVTVMVTKALQAPPPATPVPVTPSPQLPVPTASAPTASAPAPTGSVAWAGLASPVSLTGTVMLTGTAGNAAADEGLSMAQAGQLVQAQARLGEAWTAGVDPSRTKSVREAIANMADRLQFSGQCLKDDPYSKMYQVVRGDSLIAIGNKCLVPHELIMKMNHLSTSSIAAGQSLKVVQGPISLEIRKGRFELAAWLDKVCVRVYPIAIGADDKTPEGTFIVKQKIPNPPYQPQHKPKTAFKASGAPDNPLGTRWIDIGNHYGIHGTIDPTSIGREVSEGCIRLSNKDVEELFDLVVPEATKVTIKA